MGNITFSTVEYEACREELIAFKNENRTQQQDSLFFNWRYQDRPNRKHKSVIVWAETDRGNKIGACSFIPHHFSVGNAVCSVGMLGDISVAESWRGKGIAQRMFTYFSATTSARTFDFCFVLPNRDAFKSLEKAGWKTISQLKRYVRIVDIHEGVKSIVKVGWLSSLLSGFFHYLVHAISYKPSPSDLLPYNGAIVDGFDERFDDLWSSIDRSNTILGFRNRDYLTWRYSKYPAGRYRIFALTEKNDRLCGYIIFTIRTGTCFIEDILSLQEKKCPLNLLYLFIEHVKENKLSSRISITLNGFAAQSVLLSSFAFIRRPDARAVMISGDCGKRLEISLLTGVKWFLTAGDKDV